MLYGNEKNVLIWSIEYKMETSAVFYVRSGVQNRPHSCCVSSLSAALGRNC